MNLSPCICHSLANSRFTKKQQTGPEKSQLRKSKAATRNKRTRSPMETLLHEKQQPDQASQYQAVEESNCEQRKKQHRSLTTKFPLRGKSAARPSRPLTGPEQIQLRKKRVFEPSLANDLLPIWPVCKNNSKHVLGRG